LPRPVRPMMGNPATLHERRVRRLGWIGSSHDLPRKRPPRRLRSRPSLPSAAPCPAPSSFEFRRGIQQPIRPAHVSDRDWMSNEPRHRDRRRGCRLMGVGSVCALPTPARPRRLDPRRTFDAKWRSHVAPRWRSSWPPRRSGHP
jgi:hypothetical protein